MALSSMWQNSSQGVVLVKNSRSCLLTFLNIPLLQADLRSPHPERSSTTSGYVTHIHKAFIHNPAGHAFKQSVG